MFFGFVEITPQRGRHKRLTDAVRVQQVEHLVARGGADFDLFGGVELLVAQPLHTLGHEAVGAVVLRGGVGRHDGQLPPAAPAVAGLLPQLALRRREGRGVRRLDASGGDLPRRLAQTVAVLRDEHEAPLARRGDDVHPVGVFEDVVLGHRAPVGHLEPLEPDGAPGAPHQVAARKYFPGSVFGVFHAVRSWRWTKVAKKSDLRPSFGRFMGPTAGARLRAWVFFGLLQPAAGGGARRHRRQSSPPPGAAAGCRPMAAMLRDSLPGVPARCVGPGSQRQLRSP